MKIGLASDHRGYKLKQQLIEELVKRNYEVEVTGTITDDLGNAVLVNGESLVSNVDDYMNSI